MKKLGIVLLVIVFIVAGCGMLADLYPAKVPHAAKEYVNNNQSSSVLGEEPAATPEKPALLHYDSVGQLKELKDQAVVKHIEVQIDLKHWMEKDMALYSEAIAASNLNIQQAEAERAATIGTMEKPGWVLMALLGVTGLGAYFTGAKTQRPQDWNETEHQSEIERVKAEARAQVLSELALTVAVGKASAQQQPVTA